MRGKITPVTRDDFLAALLRHDGAYHAAAKTLGVSLARLRRLIGEWDLTERFPPLLQQGHRQPRPNYTAEAYCLDVGCWVRDLLGPSPRLPPSEARVRYLRSALGIHGRPKPPAPEDA